MKQPDQFYFDASSFIDETVAIGLVNLIPGIGGSIGSVISNIQAERKQQRINEFLRALKIELEKLSGKVNNEYLSQSDFLDLFEGTSRKVMSQRSKIKREALKNNFVNGIIAPIVDYDKVEYYEKLINESSETAIMILLALDNPEKFLLPKKRVGEDNRMSIESWAEQLFPDVPQFRIVEFLIFLESQWFIQSGLDLGMDSTIFMFDAFKGQMTKRGKDFMYYISYNLILS